MENEPPGEVNMFELVKPFPSLRNCIRRVSSWLLCTLFLISAAACDGKPAVVDTGDTGNRVAAVLGAIHSTGIDPSTIRSQLEPLAFIESGDPDEYGWTFTSSRTTPGVMEVSAEFQSNDSGAESEWSLLTVTIKLDASAVSFETLASRLSDVFGEKPVALSATKPRRLIWQMSEYREVLVSEIANQSGTAAGLADSILVEYGIAQGEAE